jgi:ribosomal protein L19E
VAGTVARVRVARVTSSDSQPDVRKLVDDGYEVITFCGGAGRSRVGVRRRAVARRHPPPGGHS